MNPWYISLFPPPTHKHRCKISYILSQALVASMACSQRPWTLWCFQCSLHWHTAMNLSTNPESWTATLTWKCWWCRSCCRTSATVLAFIFPLWAHVPPGWKQQGHCSYAVHYKLSFSHAVLFWWAAARHRLSVYPGVQWPRVWGIDSQPLPLCSCAGC